MNNSLKRITSILLTVAIMAGLMLVGTISYEEVPTASATNHGMYATLASIYDYGSCPSMQGLALCGNYFYAVKTDGNDYAAAICRVHKTSGSKSWMYNGTNGSYYFYDMGHGNDLDVYETGGETTMLVATSTSGANSLVRYKISDTTATKVCGYQMVNTSGSNLSGGAIRIAKADAENFYLLFKSGTTLYTGVLPISQNGGQIVMTLLCKLDYSTAYVNGTATDLSAWSGQGMGYHDHMLYLPLSSHTTSSWNMSIVLVYDLEGASGTIEPLPDPTFKITSSSYSALFEMESCVIDPATNRLYFNTNRRVTSSDTNHDGIHYITNWTYEPQNRTTEVNNYRWEMIDNKLTSVTGNSMVYNGLAMHHGSVSNGKITKGRYATSKTIVLKHDAPWSVEWKTDVSTGGQLLFSTQAVSSYTGAPYIYVTAGNERVSIGYHNGTQYNNYGVTLSDYGVNPTTARVFRLTNKIASDGSNMVYLSVDGKELGPMNQYYVANTSQGTTSNWVAGQDFKFSYLGTNAHPVNASIEYIHVLGNGAIGAVDEPDTYRWETVSNKLTGISSFDMTENGVTPLWGTISGNVYSGVQYDLNRNVVLLHDRPWSVEWKGNYSGGSMLLAEDNNGNTEGASYLYRSSILALGERRDGLHHNYGVLLSDYGISYSDTHVFRLTNRINADGSNMVYLYVDGKEIAPMNQYFQGINAQNMTSDWVNGKDFTFTHIGTYQYRINGTLEYFQIWEDGIPAENTPKSYRWETQSSQMVNITSGNNSENQATMLAGTITNGSFTTPGYYRLEESVVLAHDRPWSVQWTMEGSSRMMLLAASNTNFMTNAPYMFFRTQYSLIAMGEYQGGAYHNYGIDLSKHGISITDPHTYCLSNKISADGSNMVYLSVDGKEIGPMNNHFQATNALGTTTNWVSGKDFVFSYMGMKDYPLENKLGYLQVFEGCTHQFSPWTTIPGTCIQAGSQSRSCTLCGHTETETLSTGNHSYTAKYVAPTCTAPGGTTYTCSVCGDTYTQTVAATGHAYTPAYTAPTCSAAGGTTYTCTGCGDSYSETVAATGHTYDNGVIIALPTCTATGVRKFTCINCGYSYQKSIYATGHTYEAVTTPPTCVTAGYTTYTCVSCGNSYVSDSVPTTGHTYNSGVVTKPTCSSDGYTTHTCKTCGSSYKDNIVSATGHSYKSTVTAPTCTADGYTTYTCTKCTDRYVSNTIPATGHKYQSTVTAPTCTTDGYTTHKCTTCGYQYTSSTVTATGHTYANGWCLICGNQDPSYSTVTVPTLSLRYPSFAFEDEILYQIYYAIDDVSDVVEMGLMTFATRNSEGTVADAMEIIPGYVANSNGTYTVSSNGIPAKMLGDMLFFKVYAKLSDGTYAYSPVAGYNAKLYANDVLSSNASTKTKALMVAMLNYGAAAQIQFNYKTDDLVNSFLTDAQRALVMEYNESMISPVVPATSAKAGHFVMNKTGFPNVYPAVSFEGAFAINYYVINGKTPDDGIWFLHWSAETYNSVSKLTTSNADHFVQMTNEGNRWHAAVEGIAPKDMDKTIYIAALYWVGDTGYTTSVIPYSLGAYCQGLAAEGNALGAATAVYGYYAKAYFNS